MRFLPGRLASVCSWINNKPSSVHLAVEKRTFSNDQNGAWACTTQRGVPEQNLENLQLAADSATSFTSLSSFLRHTCINQLRVVTHALQSLKLGWNNTAAQRKRLVPAVKTLSSGGATTLIFIAFLELTIRHALKSLLEHVRGARQLNIHVQILAGVNVAFHVALERNDVEQHFRRNGTR